MRRRRWHASQRLHEVPGGLELSMEVRGTTELVSWVLGFGRHATVLEPPELRDAVRAELADALSGYEAPSPLTAGAPPGRVLVGRVLSYLVV